MNNLKEIVRATIDSRFRDSIWALRTRGDASVLSAVLHDMLGRQFEAGTDREHLEVTMGWLCAAQDALPGGGVSAFYDIRSGEWGPAYPETTGYIIPTFYDYANLTGEAEYQARAVRMANWLLSVQLESGAFPIGPLWPDWHRTPTVFDTGQILHGLVRTYQETNNLCFLESARVAGDWLIRVQDEDGCWRKFTAENYIHTYNVRSALGLLYLYQISPNEQYQMAAIKNLVWAMSQQEEDGWFRQAGFNPIDDPLTHTIAYTIEGILKSGILLADSHMVNAAEKSARSLIQCQSQNGFLRARYGAAWQSREDWSCLTGTAQMAEIWLILYQITDQIDFAEAAETALAFLKRVHPRNAKLNGIVGGIAGSYPIYREYEPYRNLNWAAKFFADSLLVREHLLSNTLSTEGIRSG
jgi:hypothetical protein